MNINMPSEVDIIIAGGGVTGCLLASRLATVYPTVSILLIEAGPNNRDVPSIRTPALFGINLAPDSGFINYYMSNPSDKLGGRSVPVAVPSVLGGGGSINIMTYARGLEDDFEGWGWPKEELVELMKKFETYLPDLGAVDTAAHGTSGEFVVGHGGGFTKYKMWVDDFLQAAGKSGFNVVPDSQNFKTSDSISPVASWVDPSNGRRQDVAHVLLHPLLDSGKTKLQVLTDHCVLRVLFNSQKKCVGVEAVSNSSPGSTITIKVKDQVILSAGTIHSPQILERSGIGGESLLSDLNIPVVSSLPGVGTNYQDHHFIPMTYKSSALPNDTLDALWSGRVPPSSPELQESKILGFSTGVVAGKIRPSVAELARMSDRFRSLYKRDFEKQNKPLALIYGQAGFMGLRPHKDGQYISMAIALAYSYSTGHVHIKSADVKENPDLDSGALNDVDEADLEILIWGYKRSRELARRMRLAAGGWEGGHPSFSEASEAGIQRDEVVLQKFQEADARGETVLPSIVYSEDDDKVIADFVRATVSTFWHYAGTCAMKAQYEGGVVDTNLNVYGVEGLKVADLSILPSLVAGNTYSTALMVGEKAAEILIQEISLQTPKR